MLKSVTIEVDTNLALQSLKEMMKDVSTDDMREQHVKSTNLSL